MKAHTWPVGLITIVIRWNSDFWTPLLMFLTVKIAHIVRRYSGTFPLMWGGPSPLACHPCWAPLFESAWSHRDCVRLSDLMVLVTFAEFFVIATDTRLIIYAYVISIHAFYLLSDRHCICASRSNWLYKVFTWTSAGISFTYNLLFPLVILTSTNYVTMVATVATNKEPAV